MIRVAFAAGLALLGGLAHADPPAPPALPLDEVIRRTIEVMDRQPERMVCRVRSEKVVLDGDGKADEDERVDIEETREGPETSWKVVHKVKNGRDVTAQAQADERRKEDERTRKGDQKGKNDDLMMPFSKKWSSHYHFELLRTEHLWGRPTYVVRVSALDHKPEAGNGTAWIDAESFVPLRGVYVPAKLPDKADWAKFQMQYVLHSNGVAGPSYLRFEGAGHWWFVRKAFRQTLRWADCR